MSRTVPPGAPRRRPDRARMPEGEAGLARLIRIDRATMNRDLDRWADPWNREIEARR